jgi:uncharacterized membrane protein
MWMVWAVGGEVGITEGTAVGFTEGTAVGCAVELLEGFAVGLVGIMVGAADGAAVGSGQLVAPKIDDCTHGEQAVAPAAEYVPCPQM